MGELQAGSDVTDSEDPGNVGMQALVDEHPAALHRDALLLEAHAGGVRAAADGDEQQLGVEGLSVLEGDVHAMVVLGRRGEANAEAEVDAALAEGALEGLGAGDVLVGHQVRQGLDDRDVGAEGLPDTGELDADHAATEDDDALGHVVEVERLVGRDDPAGDVQARQAARVGAGGQHDVGAGVLLSVDLDGVRRHEAASALDEGHVAALHEALQALVELADDAVAVLVDLGHVDALEGRAHAEGVALLGAVSDLGRMQQGLGGDAASMQAGASELVLVDEDDRHAQLGCTQGAGIATAAAAEDYQVCIGHCRPLQSRGFVIVVRRGSHPPIDGPGRYMAPCAISAASWTKVRTALPVPPLGV